MNAWLYAAYLLAYAALLCVCIVIGMAVIFCIWLIATILKWMFKSAKVYSVRVV